MTIAFQDSKIEFIMFDLPEIVEENIDIVSNHNSEINTEQKNDQIMENYKKLQETVKQFNAFVRENIYRDDDFFSMQFGEVASTNDIQELEAISNTKFPTELIEFCTKMGDLTTINGDESCCIEVNNIAKLIQKLKAPEKYDKLISMGIIDFIVNSWGNDRFEFVAGEYFIQTQIDTLNHKYKCFGLYRLGDMLEAAGYLYFDEQNNFGSLYYHQDYFDDVQEKLVEMLEKSPATQSLEELLIFAIEEIKEIVEEDL